MISLPHSLSTCLDALATGKMSSRGLVDACLANAVAKDGEGSRVFLTVYEDEARHAADRIDQIRASGAPSTSLSGIPVSIKDLFDVAGETTCAGSVVMKDAPPAQRDATIITRLRRAGAVLIGRTNMTEFAFSGLGLNPHFGTPSNPYDREAGRIPGGSSSGAAVSISDGMALVGIGSDTGGSVRIPAALCGLTAFKPTARRIPVKGMLPLSPSLDSVGWIAPTTDCCSRIDAILSSYTSTHAAANSSVATTAGMRFGILQGYVLEGLDREVAAAFENVLSSLSCAGASFIDLHFAALCDIPESNRLGGFAAFESFREHRQRIEHQANRYDPRVLSRILRGRDMSEADYASLRKSRLRIIAEADRLFDRCDIWLTPTVSRIAPLVAELEGSDKAYFENNAAMLRNPSIFNFLDGCSLSLPCHRPGEAPVGLMLSARGGDDAKLLRVGAAVEKMLRPRPLQGGCEA